MKKKAKAFFYLKTEDKIMVLLGRRRVKDEEFWWLPGGSIEGEEKPFDALIRELKEELVFGPAIIATINSFNYNDILFFQYQSGNTAYTVFFIPLDEDGLLENIKVLEEFEEMQWFNLSEIPGNMSREFFPIAQYLEENKRNL